LVPAAMTMPSNLICCNIFHVACHLGNLNVLQYLLMNFPGMLLSVTQEGFSPLHVVIINNQQEVVEFFLDQLTYIACKHSSVSSVKYSDSMHLTSSKVTSVVNMEKACEFINMQTFLGHTALHFAAIMNQIGTLKMLLSLPDSLGLDIETKDKMQFTPLHAATFANATEAVQCLLEHNANPNTISNLTYHTDVFKTPLAQACAFHHSSIFNYLLQSGAVDQDWIALQWSLSNKSYNECFFQILGMFIKQDESLNETIKLQRGKEGLSISKAVSIEWNDIPLRVLDFTWFECALSTRPIDLPSKSRNALQNVTSFSVSNCGLTVIPLEVFQLTKVVTLDLSNNNISNLPSNSVQCETLKSSGWTCTSLVKLDLSKNKLTHIPSYVFELPNLTHLDINYNCISDISMKLWSAPKLSEFTCSHNNLTTLPSKWIKYLHCITKESSTVKQSSKLGYLQGLTKSESSTGSRSSDDDDVLSSVNLMEIDNDTDPLDNDYVDTSSSMVQVALRERLIITGCGGVMIDWDKEFVVNAKTGFLVQLDFSYNQLASLPPDLPCLAPMLKHFNVSYNDLTSVSISNGFPADLKYLNLSHNPLHFINCEKEKNISMACTNPYAKANYRNRIALCMHRSHNQLLKLQILDLSYCDLYSVNLFMPSQSQKNLLEKLDYLKRSNTRHSESISLVTAVTSHLKSLDNIEVLAKLTVPLVSRLILKHNNLSAVPESVCDMLNLSSLDVAHNPLTELRKELGNLDKLWHLPLEGLSLNFPPHNIVTRGKTTDILGFLQSMLQKLVMY